MSATTQAVAQYQADQTKPILTSFKGIINGAHWLFGVAFITLMYVAVRIYEQVFAWTKGLDSFSMEFQTYWMSLFYAEVAVGAIAAFGIWGYLWKTRDRHLDQLEPMEEIRRHFKLLVWLACYTYAVYWAASYFAEQDGSWHQTVIRDSDFTPSHIILFYLSFPVYIILGVGSWLYARTRLPQYAEGISLPHTIAVVGPFLILPNVGLNEWGHTFWFMEELFSAPLHWGFVTLSWTGLALGGLMLQLMYRLTQLTNFEAKEITNEPLPHHHNMVD